MRFKVLNQTILNLIALDLIKSVGDLALLRTRDTQQPWCCLDATATHYCTSITLLLCCKTFHNALTLSTLF
jgi:hypothetical protein